MALKLPIYEAFIILKDVTMTTTGYNLYEGVKRSWKITVYCNLLDTL
jgi:hypothetical protein